MSEGLKYIDYDGALEVYRKTVVASGGGLQGVKEAQAEIQVHGFREKC